MSMNKRSKNESLSRLESNGKYNKESIALHEAAAAGDLAKIQELLSESPKQIDSADSNGMTPLMYTALNGHFDATIFLLEEGAKLFPENNDHETALDLAKKGSNESVVEIIMSHIKDDFFSHSFSSSSAWTVNNFVQKGLDINTTNKNGDTVLHLLAKNNGAKVCAQALEKGSDINAQNNDGNTPLHLAISGGPNEVTGSMITTIKILLDAPGLDMSITNKEGKTALDLAQRRSPEIMRAVKLKAEASESKATPDLEQRSPEMILKKAEDALIEEAAADEGNVAIVKECLETPGVNINAIGAAGYTALLAASTMGNLSIAELLLEHGADVTITDNGGYNALHSAVESGSYALVNLLLKNGLNVNDVTLVGSSALHLAADYGHTDIVKLLLEHGADVAAKDIAGETALDLAGELGGGAEARAEIIKMLTENILMAEVSMDEENIAIVKECLEVEGININVLDKNGFTALIAASSLGKLATATLLLNHGADINILDDKGDSALNYAAMFGHADIVKLLLEHGADVAAKDIAGETALDLAGELGGDAEARAEIIKMLIGKNNDAELDLSSQNEEGNTALHLAVLNGDKDLVEELLNKGINTQIANNEDFTAKEIADVLGSPQIKQLLSDKCNKVSSDQSGAASSEFQAGAIKLPAKHGNPCGSNDNNNNLKL